MQKATICPHFHSHHPGPKALSPPSWIIAMASELVAPLLPVPLLVYSFHNGQSDPVPCKSHRGSPVLETSESPVTFHCTGSGSLKAQCNLYSPPGHSYLASDAHHTPRHSLLQPHWSSCPLCTCQHPSSLSTCGSLRRTCSLASIRARFQR